ncbi:MAG: hypothetical protein AAB767_04795 [Patescibacteria group bacterium]
MNTLTKQTRINIKNASKVLGMKEEDILERASRYYLDAIKGEVELQREFDLWEQMSDETLAKSGF